MDVKRGFLVEMASKNMRWAKLPRSPPSTCLGNLPGFGFGLVGPYGYDLVGQDGMVIRQEEPHVPEFGMPSPPGIHQTLSMTSVTGWKSQIAVNKF